MRPYAKLTVDFVFMLEDKIRSGSGHAMIFKQMDIAFNHCECEKDFKIVLLKYLDDDRVKDKLKDHVKKKYPHMISMLDKMLILR